MAKLDDLERVEVRSSNALRAWLMANHGQSESIWLVRFKKASPHYLAYEEMVRQALCFGWIDSVPRKLDDERTMTLLSPREAGSAWSGINKRHIADLESEGLIAAPGRAAVERAKMDGSWTFLDDVERLEKPADLLAAFRGTSGALDGYNAFPPSSQRGNLEWIKQAKTPETRARRIATTVGAAAKGKRVP
ncbi:MAG: YdeI/OmpD-associated family protein [Pseudomonadota bacterium]